MTWRGNQGRKHKLDKLYKETKHGGGAYIDEKTGRIKKYSYSRNSKSPKFLKKYGNKVLRHMDDEELPQNYKKAFDYWWNLT